MNRICSTNTRLKNNRYPALLINWTEDDDGCGWKGKISIWNSENEQAPDEHTISIRQGNPLGSIYISVDVFGYGCWAMGQFEGVEITMRDLQWAALFAGQSLKDHPERNRDKKKTKT